MTFEESVGEEILYARHKKKMTQIELSQKTGISQGTISKLERGETSIRLEDYIKISKVLKMDIRLEKL